MPTAHQFQSSLVSTGATIANGTSLSATVDIGGTTLAGIVMPAAWDAANLTFQASHDGTSFNNLYDALGGEKTVTAAASRFIALDPADFAGVRYLKLRSGTSGTPVNQTVNRTVTLLSRAV